MKLRVLQLMKTLRRGGAEVLAASLVTAHRAGIEMTIGSFDPAAGTLAHDIEARGGRTLFFDAPDHARLMASVDRVARAIVRGRYDLVHCHLPLVGVVGRLAAALAGRPLVYTEHNVFAHYHPATRAAARMTWHLQRHVIAVSDEVHRSLREQPVGPPISVVKNGVDTEHFRRDPRAGAALRRQLGVADDVPLVGTVCVFRAAKRLDRWVDTARIVAARLPQTRFLIVGFGPLEEELRRMIERAGLADIVILAGPQADVRPHLSALDVYMMTSDFEGLPIALLEAMSMELPVVSTSVGGIPEVVVDRDTGVLAPPSAAALAERVVALLCTERATRLALGGRGRGRIDERHSLAAAARAIERVYDRALAEGGSDG